MLKEVAVRKKLIHVCLVCGACGATLHARCMKPTTLLRAQDRPRVPEACSVPHGPGGCDARLPTYSSSQGVTPCQTGPTHCVQEKQWSASNSTGWQGQGPSPRAHRRRAQTSTGGAQSRNGQSGQRIGSKSRKELENP